jgi:hypothetical protein
MQGKLTIAKATLKQVKVGAHFNGVEIVEEIVLGDEAHLTVKAKDLSNVWKAAIMSTKVDGSELEKIQAAKEAQAAKAAKAGK